VSRLLSVEELEDAAARAFLSPARWSAAPHDALDDHGYEVREFRVGTRARVFTDGPERPPRVASEIDVRTRALVVRPAQRERFSGRVHVELLNPSTGQDYPMYWPDLADHLISSGDAYVGVTCKQVTVEALRTIAPDRYDELSMDHDGSVWDLLAAIGASLRDESDRLLPGLARPEIVLATGWSQSGSFLRTYVSEGLHALHTAELGHPAFDAFLIGVSSGGFGPMGYIPLDRHGEMRFDDDLMPIGDPLPQLPMTDARRVVRGSAVPVLELMSEDEAVHHVWHQRPDSDTPGDLYRCYQLPGRGHESGLLDEADREADHQDAKVLGAGGGGTPPPRHTASRFLLAAAVESLIGWARHVTPPRHDPIAVVAQPGSELDPAGLDFGHVRCLLDANGVTLGGVRYLDVDLPIARMCPDDDGPLTMRAWRHEPLDAEELRRRYGSTTRLRLLAQRRAAEVVKTGAYLAQDAAAAVDAFCAEAGDF
jgi:hypothetical protein